MPRITTPNYSTRRGLELANKPKVQEKPINRMSEELRHETCVRFPDGERTWILPRISKVQANAKVYAAKIGLEPGPEFEHYISQNLVHMTPPCAECAEKNGLALGN